MPYVKDVERLKKALKLNDYKEVQSVGDLNALFTLLFIKIWNERPSYETIHKLRRAVKNAGAIHEVGMLNFHLAKAGPQLALDTVDLDIARELAFLEFYNRVGRYYEGKKASENGDVYRDVEGIPVYAEGETREGGPVNA